MIMSRRRLLLISDKRGGPQEKKPWGTGLCIQRCTPRSRVPDRQVKVSLLGLMLVLGAGTRTREDNIPLLSASLSVSALP